MITNLNFKVTFASTNKTFSGNHDFVKGLTSITGKNEKGKSLRLEMIRYALFGSKALRAEGKSYKSITAKLDFKIGQKEYTITRNGSKVNLKSGDVDVATGTSPVNSAINRIFGYDLEVFDVANACLQGQIEAMTDKRPAERKQMVDRTIGLDAVDHVLKKVSEDATATRKAIEMLDSQVIQIFETPVMPDGLSGRSIEQLDAALAEAQKSQQRRSYLKGILDSAKVEMPNPCLAIDTVADTLEYLEAEAQETEIAYANLSNLRDKYGRYLKALSIVADNDIPTVKACVAAESRKQWALYHAYESHRVEKPSFTQADIDKLRELREIEEYNSKVHLVTCPECSHAFDPEHGNPKPYDAEELKRLVTLIGSVGTPRQCEQKLFEWERFTKMEVVTKPTLVSDLDLPGLIPHIETIEEMEEEGFNLEETKKFLDSAESNYVARKFRIKDLIEEKKKSLKRISDYDIAVTKYNAYQKLCDEHGKELQTLGYMDELIAALTEERTALMGYNDSVKRYEARQEAQKAALESKAELEKNLEMLGRVRKSLSELKPKVKMHLLPSLNYVASQLINQMTNGQRTQVVVDDEFDIAVDGQPVNTLSGSAKAVANLAVRIALGTVLTNKVFSVFLADEIDAAMDDERAEYTAQCLRNLTGTISQIILVSHKEPDADNKIEL
jgi:DNA repair exonuclease SbcCD ATPase subunit